MPNANRSLPRPLNARSLWHWCYFTGNDSVMSKAVDIAELGIQSNPSGSMSGDWKKTKVSGADFGGYSSNDAAIWITQQRQHIRSLIMQLPFYARALGNVLYMPAGDASERDLLQIHNHLYKVVVRKVDQEFPIMPPERKSKIYDLVHCALSHYYDAISPSIDGQTPRNMVPRAQEVSAFMTGRGNPIDTRNFSRQWRPIWVLIINEVSAIDSQALKPLDNWIGLYFARLESEWNDEGKKTERFERFIQRQDASA